MARSLALDPDPRLPADPTTRGIGDAPLVGQADIDAYLAGGCDVRR